MTTPFVYNSTAEALRKVPGQVVLDNPDLGAEIAKRAKRPVTWDNYQQALKLLEDNGYTKLRDQLVQAQAHASANEVPDVGRPGSTVVGPPKPLTSKEATAAFQNAEGHSMAATEAADRATDLNKIASAKIDLLAEMGAFGPENKPHKAASSKTHEPTKTKQAPKEVKTKDATAGKAETAKKDVTAKKDEPAKTSVPLTQQEKDVETLVKAEREAAAATDEKNSAFWDALWTGDAEKYKEARSKFDQADTKADKAKERLKEVKAKIDADPAVHAKQLREELDDASGYRNKAIAQAKLKEHLEAHPELTKAQPQKDVAADIRADFRRKLGDIEGQVSFTEAHNALVAFLADNDTRKALAKLDPDTRATLEAQLKELSRQAQTSGA